MAGTVGFGRLEREMLSNDRLASDVRVALVNFKHVIRSVNPPRIFENNPRVLPEVAAGQMYYEMQVGQATAPTARHPTLAGSRRLVALVDAGKNVLKIYFTGDHYKPGSWWQLQHP